MENPFREIDARLSNIETLLLDIKHAQPIATPTEPQDNMMTIQEAAKFLNLTVPTLYSKVSKGELPVMKRSKRLYFSRTELMDYLKEGRRKTTDEIEQEAKAHLSNNKKGLNNGK